MMRESMFVDCLQTHVRNYRGKFLFQVVLECFTGRLAFSEDVNLVKLKMVWLFTNLFEFLQIDYTEEERSDIGSFHRLADTKATPVSQAFLSKLLTLIN